MSRLIKKTPEQVDYRESYYLQEESKLYGTQYEHFDWPSAQVALTLLLASDEMQNYCAEQLSAHQISISGFNLLNILRRKGEEGCYLNELSTLLLVSRPNITGLIDTLVKQKRVERIAEKEDRRRCKVKLTTEGEKLLKDFLPTHFQNLNQIVSPLSADEKQVLVDLLERLRGSLKKQRCE